MAAIQRPMTPQHPLPRAWHIHMTNGGGETVTAHECQIHDGDVLSFHNFLETGESVLVRAFSPRQWEQVELIDTPYSAPVQLRSLDPHEVQ